jgi:uncharacterized protein (DUF849 family)
MLESDVLRREVFIVNACITGMIPRKADTPHVPTTPEEIAADTLACYRAGASIVHLHPRDANGDPSCDPGLFGDVIAGVRESCPDIVVCASCSGRIENTLERRSVPLLLEGDLKPEMASLTCGSMNFPKTASVNSPEIIVGLAQCMKDHGIKPEVEAFEPGMIHFAKYLIDKGILDAPIYANLLLGSLGTSAGSALDLSMMVNALPENTVWAAAGIGRYQLTINSLAIAMGGGVRVGLEDNIFYDWHDRSLATNAQLIERLVRIAAELGRRPATPDEARTIIGLPLRCVAACQ